MRISRERLRKVLNQAGVRTGRRHDADRAHICEYVDFWGIMPGSTDSGTDRLDIQLALDEAGISFENRNLLLVPRDQVA